ncbi:MAG: hypothetical protein OK449_06030 [Thaumarchaeota archaeon]|nr:hypothetical protein [Nitrososphaerota archaeon]
MSGPPAEKPAAAPPVAYTPENIWEFGDIGFDTDKKLWFVQLTNENNQNVGTYMAKIVVVKRGRAIQYQWKDAQARAYWHVRERFLADDIENIAVDPSGTHLTITFKEEKVKVDEGGAPQDFSYLLYAFHLQNKDILKGNRAPLGFVEFFDAKGELIRRLNNRWIVIEDADRKSVGDYPKIRLRIDKKDIDRVLTTRSTVIIQGKSSQK